MKKYSSKIILTFLFIVSFFSMLMTMSEEGTRVYAITPYVGTYAPPSYNAGYSHGCHDGDQYLHPLKYPSQDYMDNHKTHTKEFIEDYISGFYVCSDHHLLTKDGTFAGAVWELPRGDLDCSTSLKHPGLYDCVNELSNN